MTKLKFLSNSLTIMILLSGCATAMLTPLTNAVDRGDINAVNALLDKGADVNEWQYGTALMQASSKENTDMVKLLIDRGADVNAMSKAGSSALGIAAEFGHLDIVKILIAKGADTDKAIIGLEQRIVSVAHYPDIVAKVKHAIHLIANEAGWVYYYNGQYQKAINSFNKVISLNPSISSNFDGLSLSYIALKQYDKSIAATKRSIELDPKNAGPYNTLGYAYGKKKEYDEAFKAFRKSIELNPKNYSAYFHMGKLLYDKDDYTQAAEAYKKVVELQPSKINYLITLANAYRLTGKYDDAMTYVNKAIELQTFSGIGTHIAIESNYPIVKKVIETGPAKKADVQAEDKIINVDAKSTKGWNIKQVVQSLRGASGTQVTLTIERKGVDKPLEKIITRETILDKTAATSFGLRSLIQRYNGNKEDSFMDATKAYSLDISSDWALVALGTLCLDRGKYDESIELLSKVKGGSLARILEATAYAKKGDFKKAIDIYSAIPEGTPSPKSVPTWSDRAELLKTFKSFISSKMESAGRLKTQGRYKDALIELGDALKIADNRTSEEICGSIYRIMSMGPRLSELPEEARKYALRGDVMTEQGKFEDAVKEYRKAVQAAPYIAKLYFNIAMIYGELQRHPQAIRHMKTYLQLAPEAPNARAAKDQIYKWEFAMEKKN